MGRDGDVEVRECGRGLTEGEEDQRRGLEEVEGW